MKIAALRRFSRSHSKSLLPVRTTAAATAGHSTLWTLGSVLASRANGKCFVAFAGRCGVFDLLVKYLRYEAKNIALRPSFHDHCAQRHATSGPQPRRVTACHGVTARLSGYSSHCWQRTQKVGMHVACVPINTRGRHSPSFAPFRSLFYSLCITALTSIGSESSLRLSHPELLIVGS